ncbi:glycerophosphodiester phosphodiesterase family protein [Lacinutrix sp.]|uniref:glycerophosphodiester phosphodiesterase n=1 Tax=Lacinutrix sp. TaxID=1937692 RepID=UPI0025B88E2C|nr:glycerophosphodiester phosphodiesterase family protein [Lacinutrix sp.]
MPKILKIGHRGAKGYVLENTISSILKAIELGVDGIEIDVHKCKSGELVVFHDFTIDRLTKFTGEISNFSLTQLQDIRLRNGFKIPTLIDVLEVVNMSCFINIELKGKNTAKETVDIIEKYVENGKANYKEFLVSSFQHRELETVFKLNPKIHLAVLSKANMEEATQFAAKIKAKAIHPNIALVTRANVIHAQDLGYLVNVWTVNKKEEIERMKQYKVDGIISDFPDRL